MKRKKNEFNLDLMKYPYNYHKKLDNLQNKGFFGIPVDQTAYGRLRCTRPRKVIWNRYKMRLNRTNESKVMAFQVLTLVI